MNFIHDISSKYKMDKLVFQIHSNKIGREITQNIYKNAVVNVKQNVGNLR